jgi:hypothetical protein
MARPKKIHVFDFNPNVPPMFRSKGQERVLTKELAQQIEFLAMVGPDQPGSSWEWRKVYNRANRELADMCYWNSRILGPGERSAVEWLKQAGHYDWFEDKRPIRCNMNTVMDKYNAWFSDI